jgi:hypothetical protein
MDPAKSFLTAAQRGFHKANLHIPADTSFYINLLRMMCL